MRIVRRIIISEQPSMRCEDAPPHAHIPSSPPYAAPRPPASWNATFATPSTDTNSAAYSQRSIGYSWTRGLVVAVVAFVFTFIGLVLSVFPHLIVQLIAALWLLLTLLMTLVAFAIQSELRGGA